jgi:hypothetical protein
MRETVLRMVLAVMDKKNLDRRSLKLGVVQSFVTIVQHKHTKEMANITVTIFGSGDVTATGVSDDGNGSISFRLKFTEEQLFPAIGWEAIDNAHNIYHFGKADHTLDPYGEPEYRVYTNGMIIASRGDGEMTFRMETSEEAIEFVQLWEDKIIRAHRIDVNAWQVVDTNREEKDDDSIS